MHHDEVGFEMRRNTALMQLRDACRKRRGAAALGELQGSCVVEDKIAALTKLRARCVAERKIGARLVEEGISSQA